jgi:hypothetical protein
MWVRSSMSVTEAVRVGGSCSIRAGERRGGQFCTSALHGPSIRRGPSALEVGFRMPGLRLFLMQCSAEVFSLSRPRPVY